MAGTIKLDGTTFLSKSGSDFTLDVGSDGTISQGTFNGTVGSTATFPAGHVIKVGSANLSADVTTSGTSYIDCFAPTFTPDGGPNNTSTIYAYLHLQTKIHYGNTISGLEKIRYQISGDDITNITGLDGEFFGSYRTGNTADWWDQSAFTLMLAPRTLDGTGNAPITYDIDIGEASSSSYITIYGNNTSTETHLQFWEVI